MKKLLQEYGFNSDMQYFEMIAESFLNGQKEQAINQFKALPKEYKKKLLISIISENWNCEITKNNTILLLRTF
jgi:hypothetical protein